MDRPNFEEFFEGTLRGRLQAMEEVRSNLKFRALGCIALAVGVGGVVGLAWVRSFSGLAWVRSFSLEPMVFIVPGPLTLILAGYFWFRPGWQDYVARFKGEIIAEVVRFISPDLRYQPGAMISRDAYVGSGIFPKEPHRYNGEDYVSGKVGATALRFSEIHSEYKTETTDRNGHRTEHWHTIFRGLFFEGDFNKHFGARTYVLTDVAEKWLGTLVGQAVQGSHQSAELVKLEDPVFEKEFVVHGTDQIEARYILSPALMTRIVEFKKKAGRAVQFSFIDSNVYVAIPYSKNLFEPRLFRSGVSLEQIKGYYEALALTISIVEDLNLNTRIWTKA